MSSLAYRFNCPYLPMLPAKPGTLLDVHIRRFVFLPFPQVLDTYGLNSASHRQRMRKGKMKKWKENAMVRYFKILGKGGRNLYSYNWRICEKVLLTRCIERVLNRGGFWRGDTRFLLIFVCIPTVLISALLIVVRFVVVFCAYGFLLLNIKLELFFSGCWWFWVFCLFFNFSSGAWFFFFFL